MLALMDVRIIGSNIGNAKMAVSVELLLVFEAKADTKVNIPEIPVLPKKSIQKKILMFSMGLLNKIVKKSRLTKPITKSKMALYINFEMIKACGLHKL